MGRGKVKPYIYAGGREKGISILYLVLQGSIHAIIYIISRFRRGGRAPTLQHMGRCLFILKCPFHFKKPKPSC